MSSNVKNIVSRKFEKLFFYENFLGHWNKLTQLAHMYNFLITFRVSYWVGRMGTGGKNVFALALKTCTYVCTKQHVY